MAEQLPTKDEGMRGLRTILRGGLVVATLSALACQAQTVGNTRGALLSGSKSVATVDSPAVLDLLIVDAQIHPQAQLELTVSPTLIRPGDSYIVRVLNAENGKPVGRELGSFSFYPPATKNQPRTFLVGVPRLSKSVANDKGNSQVAVELVPVDRASSADHGSEIEILAARLVTPDQVAPLAN